jgi:hypothetical protein
MFSFSMLVISRILGTFYPKFLKIIYTFMPMYRVFHAGKSSHSVHTHLRVRLTVREMRVLFEDCV